jgi:hypothetical protein
VEAGPQRGFLGASGQVHPIDERRLLFGHVSPVWARLRQSIACMPRNRNALYNSARCQCTEETTWPSQLTKN